jgi:hypothetical protein
VGGDGDADAVLGGNVVVMMLVDVNVLMHVDRQRWGELPGVFSGDVRFGFLLAVCIEDIILSI